MKHFKRQTFRTLGMIFILMVAICTYAQNPITRRGKVSVKKTTTSQRNTAKQRTKPKAKRPNAYNIYNYNADSIEMSYEVVDSAAEVTNAPESSMTSGGFALYGRVRDYTDNAEAQKTVATSLRSSENAKTGCLTNRQAIIINGGNGYSFNGLSSGMKEALRYCNEKKYTVTDVTTTDSGWWCVVYNDNKYKGNLPQDCEIALKDYIKAGEKILSISISENGNYAIVTNLHYKASNSVDTKILAAAAERFGHINAVCITNIGIMVTCNKGAYYWDVPTNVIERMKKMTSTPTLIRYTDSGTYMALNGTANAFFYM